MDSKIKLLAFDLDGTVTQHKSPLEKENLELFRALSKKYKLLMVGAGGCILLWVIRLPFSHSRLQ